MDTGGFTLYLVKDQRWVRERNYPPDARAMAVWDAVGAEVAGMGAKVMMAPAAPGADSSLVYISSNHAHSHLPTAPDAPPPQEEGPAAQAVPAPAALPTVVTAHPLPPAPVPWGTEVWTRLQPLLLSRTTMRMGGSAGALIAAAVGLSTAARAILFARDSGSIVLSLGAAVLAAGVLGCVVYVLFQVTSEVIPHPVEETAAPLPDIVDREARPTPATPSLVANPDRRILAQPDVGGLDPTLDRKRFATEISILATVAETAVEALWQVPMKMDAHARFGLCLFLLGHLTDGRESEAAFQRVLATFGVDVDTADKLLSKRREYAGTPAYATMVDRGRHARKERDGGIPTDQEVRAAIMDWVGPKIRTADGVWTIGFTDIAGSTELTQGMGDKAAQQLVRVHDAIVRTALLSHGGKEVKHTGDGIMMAFMAVADAAAAAAAILKDVAVHAAANPALKFQVRIGLATGVPVVEGGDYFGSVVQLAARLAAAAEPGHGLVSEATAQGCPGVPFGEPRELTLKGFAEPQRAFALPV